MPGTRMNPAETRSAWLVIGLAVMLLPACQWSDDDDDDDAGAGASDCSDRNFTVPSTRGEMGGVWDATNERFVFFGGDQGTPIDCIPQPDFTSELWAFYPDCDNFELLDDGGGPSARSRHATALDATRNRLLVQGGRWREADSGNYDLYDELWAFDLESGSWTELETSDGPSARVSHTMVVSGDSLLLYGGNTSSSSTSYNPSGELWSLDLLALEWTLLESEAEAGERHFHAAAVRDDGLRMYVYGGGDENAYIGPFFGDLWVYKVDEGSWSELDNGRNDAPEGRIWPNLLSDSARDRLLLWAGHDDASLGNTNQVWAFDLNEGDWTELEAGDTYANPAYGFCDFPDDFTDPDLTAPERRYGGAAALSDSELLVFGGKTDCGQVNDVWGWSLTDQVWTERSAATFGEICARTFASDCESLCF